MWSPADYARFRDARRRPFFELLARVDAATPLNVADLGCGTGELTRELLRRWPTARVDGVDSSAQMLAEAQAHALEGRLVFTRADLASWAPPAPLDVLVSNAALHWVPGHRALLERLVGMLAPGGTLAFQVPANFEAPSHRLVEGLRASVRFGPWLAGVQGGHVEPLGWYVAQLGEWGLEVDAWETTYLHLLPGPDAVLEWLRGTTLRPILAALPPAEAGVFLTTLRPLLREAYPPAGQATPFPFSRRFVVARRPG